MCVTLPVGVAIASITVSVAAAAAQTAMQMQAAAAQNARAQKEREAARDAEVRKLQDLAAQEQEMTISKEKDKENLGRQEARALAASKQASADANIGGQSSQQLMNAIRRQRLEGVQAADTNLANMRAQVARSGLGVSAEAQSRINNVQFANPNAALAGGLLDIGGSILGGLMTDVGGGDGPTGRRTLAEAVYKGDD